jgi:hypothetical protein
MTATPPPPVDRSAQPSDPPGGRAQVGGLEPLEPAGDPGTVLGVRHKVLATVLAAPGSTATEVMKLTGRSAAGVYRVLHQLETAGLLRQERADIPGAQGVTPARWYPTDRLDLAGSDQQLHTPAADRTPPARRPRRGPAKTGLLAALVDTLPAPGTALTAGMRRKWLSAAEVALALLYPEPDPPAAEDT